MKPLLLISLLSFSIGVNVSASERNCMPDRSVTIGNGWVNSVDRHAGAVVTEADSLTAERFFSDSLGNQYMIEYRYVKDNGALFIIKEDSSTFLENAIIIDDNKVKAHQHYIAICSIIAYKGNRQQTIKSGIKAIYSPTECSSDEPKLWLKRLYDYNNKR